MSWSVSFKGKVGDAKAALAKQFESAKTATANLAEEQDSVCMVEDLVNHHLDVQVAGGNKLTPHVEVNCHGSASVDWSVSPSKVFAVSVGVTVTPMNDPSISQGPTGDDGGPVPTGGPGDPH